MKNQNVRTFTPKPLVMVYKFVHYVRDKSPKKKWNKSIFPPLFAVSHESSAWGDFLKFYGFALKLTWICWHGMAGT